jgi:hypothetical protein
MTTALKQRKPARKPAAETAPQAAVMRRVPAHAAEAPTIPSGAFRAAVLGAGASILAAVACWLYLPIASRFLSVSSDHTTHVAFAEQLYRTHHLPVPHFLYHVLMVLLVIIHPAMTFQTAGLVVLGLFYGLTGAWLYRESAKILAPGRCSLAALLWGGLAAALFSAAILVMQPVILPGDTQMYKIGYFWGEPYYSPTFSVMKPLALISALCAVALLNAQPGRRPSWRAVSIAAMVTAASALAKPSFVICLLPAVLVYGGLRLIRGRSIAVKEVMAGLVAPAALVLALQYALTYSGSLGATEYRDKVIFAPFMVLGYYAVDLFPKFILSILFPVAVYLAYLPRSLRDTGMNLGFLLFGFGASFGCLLAEANHWWAGNFLWSGYIALFVLFVFSALFYLRQVLRAPWSPLEVGRHLAVLAILILHVRSGILTESAFLHTQLGQY